jgi:hypothetical protein
MADSPTRKTGAQDYGSKEVTTQAVTTEDGAPVSVLEDGSLDPVYEAKAKVLNKAIQDIGMGRYQWQVSAVYASLLRLHRDVSGVSAYRFYALDQQLPRPSIAMNYHTNHPSAIHRDRLRMGNG